jgi:uncharacterized membrane protein
MFLFLEISVWAMFIVGCITILRDVFKLTLPTMRSKSSRVAKVIWGGLFIGVWFTFAQGVILFKVLPLLGG